MIKEYNSDIVLSICIMSYNRRHMIIGCIDEILTYEGNDIEVIVSDNASTDGTWEELCKIQDKRLHIYQNEKNMGMQYNIMKAQILGSGKYIMPMNDRDRIDMEELRKFVRVLARIDAEVICANGMRYLKSDFMTYQQRVYAISSDGGHPGWWIRSRRLFEKADRALNGSWFDEDSVKLGRISFHFEDLNCQSKKWFCYEKRVVLNPPLEKLAKIQSNRGDSAVAKQLFFGLDAKKFHFKFIIENACSCVGGRRQMQYIKGKYAAGAHLLFEEYYYYYMLYPEMCMRYNCVPPKHIWWMKDGIEFWLSSRQCLIDNGKLNKEIDKYIFEEMARQYVQFKKRRFKENVFKVRQKIEIEIKNILTCWQEENGYNGS